MSDVFLLEECSDMEREKACEILGLSNILKQSEFLKHAVNHNIELINCLYYKSDLNFHYTNCYNLAKENELSDKITDYFNKWIDASQYLTSGIFVFKKILINFYFFSIFISRFFKLKIFTEYILKKWIVIIII